MSAAGLAGKVALIVGATSGIGQATAFALADAGATVVICGRRAERLSEMVLSLKNQGKQAWALRADAMIEDQARSAVEATIEKYGLLDILINSAGVMQLGGLERCDIDEYRNVFDVNFFATLYTCRAAIPHMVARGTGDIVNVSSLVARKGGAQTSAYSASKHALNSMTDAMRQELGERGIRVATLMPGATRTEIGDRVSDPNWRAAMKAHVEKDDAVNPADIGRTIAFMLSLPRNVTISEISVRPTSDITA